MTARISYLLVAALVVLGLAGCGKQGGQGGAAGTALLELVPADTPYVAVSTRRLPKKLVERQLAASAASANENTEKLRQLLEEGELPSDSLEKLARLGLAISEEVQGKLTPEGIASLGFPLQGRNLIYGLGLLPVGWAEITDAAKVNAFLDRVEKRAGVHSTPASFQNVNYRRYDLGRVVLVAAIRDDHLVVGGLPARAEQTLLPRLLGLEKPQQSLAAAGTLKAFDKTHGFTDFGSGYVDLRRLLEMVLGEARGLNAEVLDALGFERPPVSPGCRNLAGYLVGQVPKIGFGFVSADDQGYRLDTVVEAAPPVANWFKTLSAPVPGLGADRKGLFEAGLALDLTQLRGGIKKMLATVIEQGRDCERVKPEALKQAMQSVDVMFNPMLASIRGFDLVLDEVRMGPNGEPAGASGHLLIAALDPRGLLGMLGMFSPDLAALQVPADGTPVRLPLDKLSPQAPPMWVASKDQALAVFFGSRAPADTSAVLSAAPGPQGLLLVFRYNMKKLFALIGPALKQLPPMGGAEEQEMRKQLESMAAVARHYERVEMGIQGRDDGLVISSTIRFATDAK